MSRCALMGRLVGRNIHIFQHKIYMWYRGKVVLLGGALARRWILMQYHQWPLGKQEARGYFSPFPGWKLHPRLLAVTLIIFFLQQTWRRVNLNFPGGRFKRTSAHIFFCHFLSEKKLAKSVTFSQDVMKQYFMRWAGRKWQPSAALPTQVNSPAWGAEGKKVICEETDLPGRWRVLLCWFSPRQVSGESRAYGDTLTGNWGESRPILKLCVGLK